jgi:CRISPR type III-B/RAMP module-associated protein Cmr3
MTKRNSTAWVWQFSPIDTWFFREAKPIEAATGQAARAVFPPTPFTMAGAMRAILKQLDVDSTALATAFDGLQLRGVYVLLDGKRIYPVPACLLMAQHKPDLVALVPGLGHAVHTDVCDAPLLLPKLNADKAVGAKPIDGGWLRSEDFLRMLCGAAVSRAAVITHDELFTRESRIGIARTPGARVAEEGLLYQVEHLRMRRGVALQVTTNDLPDKMQTALGVVPMRHLVRFGGEGRMASVSVQAVDYSASHQLPALSQAGFQGKQGLRIVFTTPLLYRNGSTAEKRKVPPALSRYKPRHVPDEKERHGDWMRSAPFKRVVVNGIACWETTLLKGAPEEFRSDCIRLRICSAAQQRLEIEGSWDFENPSIKSKRALEKEPRGSVRRSTAYLPAGTTWLCHLLDGEGVPITDAQQLYQAAVRLHGYQLGMERVMGRGEIAVGSW